MISVLVGPLFAAQFRVLDREHDFGAARGRFVSAVGRSWPLEARPVFVNSGGELAQPIK